jgi:hypothetical protein
VNAISLQSFSDELHKIATAKSEKLNMAFGLRGKKRKTTVGFDNPPVGALTADRSSSAISGDATQSVTTSNLMSPAFGPGGV